MSDFQSTAEPCLTHAEHERRARSWVVAALKRVWQHMDATVGALETNHDKAAEMRNDLVCAAGFVGDNPILKRQLWKAVEMLSIGDFDQGDKFEVISWSSGDGGSMALLSSRKLGLDVVSMELDRALALLPAAFDREDDGDA